MERAGKRTSNLFPTCATCLRRWIIRQVACAWRRVETAVVMASTGSCMRHPIFLTARRLLLSTDCISVRVFAAASLSLQLAWRVTAATLYSSPLAAAAAWALSFWSRARPICRQSAVEKALLMTSMTELAVAAESLWTESFTYKFKKARPVLYALRLSQTIPDAGHSLRAAFFSS